MLNDNAYDKHILVTMLCIFLQKIGLKPRYFALYIQRKTEIFLNIVPPLKCEVLLTVQIAR